MNATKKWPAVVALGLVLLLVGGTFARKLATREASVEETGTKPVPIALAEIEVAAIENRRVFTGTLEASAQFVVAPKVGGRVVSIEVDLADVVTRGQVVAKLDDAEFRQAVAQAKAERSVARAQQAAARKRLQIAQRDFARVNGLRKDGVVSDAELDAAMASKLEAEAAVEVAIAQVSRATASLGAAEIRKSYTEIVADWPEGDAERVVASRFADEGVTVAMNAPLLEIVDLDPVVVVVHATEEDYADLAVGQRVDLTTDAYRDEVFAGVISRVAPVFRTESRQARIELEVQNPDGRLRPGMFVRAQAVLARLESATVVPFDAIVTRDGKSVVFVVASDEKTVTMHPVEVGIQEGDRVQVSGEGLTGRVVVLGQQQLQDGSAVVVPGESTS